MTYQLAPDCIVRLADHAFIPPDPENLDYAAYLEWVAAGNTPLPYVEPEKPPEPSLKDKMAAMGIDLAELKTALEAV